MPQELSIYLHIPFCVRKCAYCDFLSFPAEDETQRAYVRTLAKEVRACPCETDAYEIVSVFIGGGTPSILPGVEIEKLLAAVRAHFLVRTDAEITIEANPGTLTADKLAAYRRAGVNRLSIGLQSAHDDELRLLGRIHTFAQFQESYRLAREAGFANISVDLMSGLPGQSLDSWEDTLGIVTALAPQHISAYSLIIEEGTPFYEQYHAEDMRRAKGGQTQMLPDEETERSMYTWTGRYLQKKGYGQYEISNYSRPGFESRHNIGYWIRRPYLGFGLGASSFFQEKRWKNTEDMRQYLSKNAQDVASIETLTREDAIDEQMFLGLRMRSGVCKRTFSERFGCEIQELFGEEIAQLKKEGLLEETDEAIRLTDEGILVSNYCIEMFL